MRSKQKDFLGERDELPFIIVIQHAVAERRIVKGVDFAFISAFVVMPPHTHITANKIIAEASNAVAAEPLPLSV